MAASTKKVFVYNILKPEIGLNIKKLSKKTLCIPGGGCLQDNFGLEFCNMEMSLNASTSIFMNTPLFEL